MSLMPPRLHADRARAFHAATAIGDTLLPWAPGFLPHGADLIAVLDRFRAAGARYVSITVAAGMDGAATALTELAARRAELVRAGDRYQLNQWPSPAIGALDGPTLVDFHFQSGTPFEREPRLVAAFRALGVRQALIAYNERNLLGDGCHERCDAGLSRLGVAMVEAMNGAGMIVDISHCGERTGRDAMEVSGSPVIISHSNAHALYDHARNVSDELARDCARRGGFVGVNGVGMFLGADDGALEATIARHIAHFAALIGPDRVGFASDFMFLDGSDYGFFHGNRSRFPAGYPPPPWPFLAPERLVTLTAALFAMGCTEAEIAGFYGGNYCRVAAAIVGAA